MQWQIGDRQQDYPLALCRAFPTLVCLPCLGRKYHKLGLQFDFRNHTSPLVRLRHSKTDAIFHLAFVSGIERYGGQEFYFVEFENILNNVVLCLVIQSGIC